MIIFFHLLGFNFKCNVYYFLLQKSKYTRLFQSWDYNRINYLIFFFGIIVIISGYLLMWSGETTSFQSVKLAPVILVLGYCVIIPVSLLYRKKNK